MHAVSTTDLHDSLVRAWLLTEPSSKVLLKIWKTSYRDKEAVTEE